MLILSFHHTIFTSCKIKEDEAAGSSPGDPKIRIFNICILIYINLYAPFKRFWLQLCKIKHITPLDSRVESHIFQSFIACPMISLTSPLCSKKFLPFSLIITITINFKKLWLSSKTGINSKYTFSYYELTLESSVFLPGVFTPFPPHGTESLFPGSVCGTIIWEIEITSGSSLQPFTQ